MDIGTCYAKIKGGTIYKLVSAEAEAVCGSFIGLKTNGKWDLYPTTYDFKEFTATPADMSEPPPHTHEWHDELVKGETTVKILALLVGEKYLVSIRKGTAVEWAEWTDADFEGYVMKPHPLPPSPLRKEGEQPLPQPLPVNGAGSEFEVGKTYASRTDGRRLIYKGQTSFEGKGAFHIVGTISKYPAAVEFSQVEPVPLAGAEDAVWTGTVYKPEKVFQSSVGTRVTILNLFTDGRVQVSMRQQGKGPQIKIASQKALTDFLAGADGFDALPSANPSQTSPAQPLPPTPPRERGGETITPIDELVLPSRVEMERRLECAQIEITLLKDDNAQLQRRLDEALVALRDIRAMTNAYGDAKPYMLPEHDVQKLDGLARKYTGMGLEAMLTPPRYQRFLSIYTTFGAACKALVDFVISNRVPVTIFEAIGTLRLDGQIYLRLDFGFGEVKLMHHHVGEAFRGTGYTFDGWQQQGYTQVFDPPLVAEIGRDMNGHPTIKASRVDHHGAT